MLKLWKSKRVCVCVCDFDGECEYSYTNTHMNMNGIHGDGLFFVRQRKFIENMLPAANKWNINSNTTHTHIGRHTIHTHLHMQTYIRMCTYVYLCLRSWSECLNVSTRYWLRLPALSVLKHILNCIVKAVPMCIITFWGHVALSSVNTHAYTHAHR